MQNTTTRQRVSYLLKLIHPSQNADRNNFRDSTHHCLLADKHSATHPPLNYRAPGICMYFLLSRTQAGPGRTVKQEQEQTSRNHVQTFSGCSVQHHQCGHHQQQHRLRGRRGSEGSSTLREREGGVGTYERTANVRTERDLGAISAAAAASVPCFCPTGCVYQSCTKYPRLAMFRFFSADS